MADDNRINDFYEGTTKQFQVTCKINGAAVDITADTVTFRMKTAKDDKDTDAVLTKVADVASQGANGIAVFELSEIETKVAPETYYCDIEWDRSNDNEYVVYDDQITVKPRVSDTPPDPPP